MLSPPILTQKEQVGLNAEKNKIAKNKSAVITAIIAGFITLFFCVESFQALLANLFGAENVVLKYNLILLLAEYNLTGLKLLSSIIITLSPIMFLIIITEIVTILQQKVSADRLSNSLMLYRLILIGYLLLFVFYETVTVILREFMSSDFVIFINHINLKTPVLYFLLFALIVLTAGYINLHTKRISSYINR